LILCVLAVYHMLLLLRHCAGTCRAGACGAPPVTVYHMLLPYAAPVRVQEKADADTRELTVPDDTGDVELRGLTAPDPEDAFVIENEVDDVLATGRGGGGGGGGGGAALRSTTTSIV
jgi:hypothetical protein